MSWYTIVGSLNTDLVTRVNRSPDAGETVLASGFQRFQGGKGANEAVALARLLPSGSKVRIVGCIGSDNFGDDIFKSLKQEGIDVSSLKRLEGEASGTATIVVDKESENRIIVYPGANALVKPEHVTDEVLNDSAWVLFQNEIPLETTLEVMKRAKAAGAKTVYNPSPLLKLPPNTLELVDVLLLNAGEACAVAHVDSVSSPEDAIDAAASLCAKGVGLVVITLGEEGAAWYSSCSGGGHRAAHSAGTLVDTTCAGDTFLGALISQLGSGADISSAVEFSNRASGVAVTREGAQSSIPRLAEL